MSFLRAEWMATAHGMCRGQSKDRNLGFKVQISGLTLEV